MGLCMFVCGNAFEIQNRVQHAAQFKRKVILHAVGCVGGCVDVVVMCHIVFFTYVLRVEAVCIHHLGKLS